MPAIGIKIIENPLFVNAVLWARALKASTVDALNRFRLSCVQNVQQNKRKVKTESEIKNLIRVQDNAEYR